MTGPFAWLFIVLLPLVGVQWAVLIFCQIATDRVWLDLHGRHQRFANFLWGFGFNPTGRAPWQRKEQQ